MQLTRRADYALRVLIHVASHPDERVTAARVAQDFGLSSNHIAKVAMELVHHGWLRGVRGRAGRLELAVAPDQIRVGDVVRAMEPEGPLVECFDPVSNTCPIIGACRLERVLGEALDCFVSTLNRYTLADILVNQQHLVRRLAKARAAALLAAQEQEPA